MNLYSSASVVFLSYDRTSGTNLMIVVLRILTEGINLRKIQELFVIYR